MVLGDPEPWKMRFITIDERILRRISAVWIKCVSLLSKQAEEDTITINLVNLLFKDRVVRRICHWVEFQFEPLGVAADGAVYSKGKIDMAVLLDWERKRYLAYECKRLNVITSGTRSSLGTRYVTEGVMRFVTEQYAEGLPIGCMLGYVMDGDIPFAVQQVHKAISANQSPLALVCAPVTAPKIDQIERFVTTHVRPTTKTTIEVRHALLAF
jgi:hypothetical protein